MWLRLQAVRVLLLVRAHFALGRGAAIVVWGLAQLALPGEWFTVNFAVLMMLRELVLTLVADRAHIEHLVSIVRGLWWVREAA